LIDEAMEQRLLAARRAFAERLPPELRGAVEFYDEARYNAASTLQDNILFGRLVYGQAQAGKRLTAAQRQKVDLARALIKRPDILVLSEATALLDAAAQTAVMEKILAARRGQSVIWMLHRPSLARSFDR